MTDSEFDDKIQEFWEQWLRDRGWSTWYNPKYWVHRDSVEDQSRMDYTNYGMNWQDAVKYERLGRPKHRFCPLPILSKIELAKRTKGLTAKPSDLEGGDG